MSPGPVTISDVARHAGVSSMTVSRVINESARVSPETRRRVEDAIAELGYVPSRLARGLIRKRTGTLAVIVPDVANPFFTLIVRGAEDVARRSGYRVLLCDTRADLELEREAVTQLKDAIAHAETVRDYVSRDLFSDILENEEKHIDMLEQQFDMIEQMGLPNYIQLQSKPAED